VYVGCWKSLFCWHKEDLDLYSINFLHFGKPKFWYCIDPEHAQKFERFCSFQFHDSQKMCKDFLRHKTTLISPNILKNAGISIRKMVQNPGEFMVIFPHGYHSGFNFGLNCAEAVNFALPGWVNIGKRATRCLCQPDSVSIDWEVFEKNIKRKRSDSTSKKPRKQRKLT